MHGTLEADSSPAYLSLSWGMLGASCFLSASTSRSQCPPHRPQIRISTIAYWALGPGPPGGPSTTLTSISLSFPTFNRSLSHQIKYWLPSETWISDKLWIDFSISMSHALYIYVSELNLATLSTGAQRPWPFPAQFHRPWLWAHAPPPTPFSTEIIIFSLNKELYLGEEYN